MSRALTAAMAIAITLAGCHEPPKCPDAITVVERDGGTTTVVVTGPDGGVIEEPFDVAGGYASPECAAACTTLQRVGCPEARTRPGEDSCYVVCKRAEATRGRIDFKPRCVAAARTREAVLACGTYECR